MLFYSRKKNKDIKNLVRSELDKGKSKYQVYEELLEANIENEKNLAIFIASAPIGSKFNSQKTLIRINEILFWFIYIAASVSAIFVFQATPLWLLFIFSPIPTFILAYINLSFGDIDTLIFSSAISLLGMVASIAELIYGIKFSCLSISFSILTLLSFSFNFYLLINLHSWNFLKNRWDQKTKKPIF